MTSVFFKNSKFKSFYIESLLELTPEAIENMPESQFDSLNI